MSESEDVELYEDALLSEGEEIILEGQKVHIHDLEDFSANSFGDQLAENVGYPLLMNVRWRVTAYDPFTQSVIFDIRGWNPE